MDHRAVSFIKFICVIFPFILFFFFFFLHILHRRHVLRPLAATQFSWDSRSCTAPLGMRQLDTFPCEGRTTTAVPCAEGQWSLPHRPHRGMRQLDTFPAEAVWHESSRCLIHKIHLSNISIFFFFFFLHILHTRDMCCGRWPQHKSAGTAVAVRPPPGCVN